ncbi:hypothetical protein N9W01_00705 [bacterium]|nr:hypothetical protein [bacterium]
MKLALLKVWHGLQAFAVIAFVALIPSMAYGLMILLGGCSSSVGVVQYQADFEKSESLYSLPPFEGEKQIVQLSKLNVNKELWEMFPELRDKRVGLGVSNRIIENFEMTQRFKYAEEKEAIQNQMLDAWEAELTGMGNGETKLKMEGIALPKYIVYAEIYDFAVSYGETYNKGKVQKTNTTIMGIQIRMVNVDNSQYIVASGQGTATQVGEGFFKNPQMGFDQSTTGIATQRALEVATVNLVKRMEAYGW